IFTEVRHDRSCALETMKFDREVNYARKRGLVEEINRSVQGVEEDAIARAQTASPRTVSSGPVAPAPPKTE
ncbi:MAG: hypothetical protein ABI678_07135, partial [Kofleriaceae bacterium]